MTVRLFAASLVCLAFAAGLGPAPIHAASAAAATRVQWHDCKKSLAEWTCGTLTVPRDWFDRSNANTFGIEFAIHRATERRVGTLTLNPGGPGGASLGIADLLVDLVPDRIERHFDIVLWDPRGVGSSGPFLSGCALPPGLPEPPDVGAIDWQRVAADHLAANAAANTACLEANAGLAPYLGTQYVVRDMEALRRALDIPRWTYWGMSYGTRIGLLYAQLYPGRLRALLLDGSVAPNSSIAQISAGMGAGHGQSLAVLGSLLSKETAARMHQVIRALERRTYVDDAGGTVTRWEFLFSLFQGAREQAALPDVAEMINGAYRALFRPTDVRRSAVVREEPDYGRLYTLRFVNCADYADRPSDDRVGQWASSSAEVGTAWAGLLTVTFTGYCAGLPPFAHPMPRVTGPLTLPQPPVVLNALGDPATPWTWARTMATYFRGSSLISYGGATHVIYGATPSRCVNRSVTRYLMDLRAPGDISCPFAPTVA